MSDDLRRQGMVSLARSILGKSLPHQMTVSEGAMFRAGEFDAAAAVLMAAGDDVGALNMRAMAETWVKIARDA